MTRTVERELQIRRALLERNVTFGALCLNLGSLTNLMGFFYTLFGENTGIFIDMYYVIS